MILRTTGDIREVANSAWVSTTDEIKIKKKTDQEVERVVKFLIDHAHTSPLEVVSLTLELDGSEENNDCLIFSIYAADKYSRALMKGPIKKFTIDLLNFVKITFKNNLWQETPFLLFSQQHPVLAQMLKDFKAIQDTSSPDVEMDLGDHGMSVELINFHDGGDFESSRATWRIKCPLAISLQFVRHRTGSYNQSSGRYRTLHYSISPLAKDVKEISERAGVNLAESFMDTEVLIQKYLKIMKDLKDARDNGKISNDEYKRARECARFILPEGRMTEMYATFYLSDFYGNYKMLRDSIHAQKEHVYIAQKMHQTLEVFMEKKYAYKESIS